MYNRNKISKYQKALDTGFNEKNNKLRNRKAVKDKIKNLYKYSSNIVK
jgi:hypothetical protein